MRPVLLAAAVTVLALTAPTAGLAQTYPWCAQYSGLAGGGRNCGFVSYSQCMATVSGIGGFCERNLYYQERETPVRRPRKALRRD